MMSENRRHTRPCIPLLAAGCLFLLGGCSEENLAPEPGREGKICFSVNATQLDGTRAASATSPEGAAGRKARELKGGEKPMYLLSEVSEMEVSQRSVTRGVALDASTIESFGVYAERADRSAGTLPDYMRNVEVTRANDWTPSQDYFWPSDSPLRFTAYSPYCASVSQNGEGIVRLPDEVSPQTLVYTVPAELESQQDLMWAEPKEASASPCPLSFAHAVAAVSFATGSEFTASTVKSITLSGIVSGGMLDITTGEWSDLSGSVQFSAAPDLTVEAQSDSDYAPSGVSLLPKGESFLMIPQTLGADATATLVIEKDGEQKSLTASLEGETWESGKRITYLLSANPWSDTLHLEVTGDLNSPYTGSTLPFTVSSYLDGEEKTPVSWQAEFVDEDGAPVSAPSWVLSMTDKGSGSVSGQIRTTMNEMLFHAMSAATTRLQKAADINSSSGHTPYNLSSSTGSTTPEETANSYIVSAPGQYSLPLVYGNAIKGGADNQSAYVSSSHNRYALKRFLNHLGNGITSPYIYDNTGCVPDSARIVWNSRLGLVRNVRLSEDKKSLLFDVPANTIREGNAIVAVTDADDNVMWSWQIWVTDYSPADNLLTLPGSSGTFELWSRNLGYVAGGDDVEFPEAKAYIRFTQTEVPEGMEAKSVTVTLSQAGKENVTSEGNTFYQWGRKDPMMSTVTQWFGPDNLELTSLPITDVTVAAADPARLPVWWIKNPEVMVSAGHDVAISYTNLWNANLATTENVKTVYDPSPAGYKVDPGYNVRSWGNNLPVTAEGNVLTVTLNDGTLFSVKALGYRAANTGELNGVGSNSNFWFASCMTTRKSAGCFVASGSLGGTQTNSLYIGFSLRPIPDK